MPISISKKFSLLVGLPLFAVFTIPVLVLAADEPIRTTLGPANTIITSKAATAVTQLIQPSENETSVLRERLASKSAALKAKLEAFKDKKKAGAATRVSTNLNAVNQNQTAQMQKNLGVMSTILDKLEDRVNQGTPDIKDPKGAKAAIASARLVIASTSATISAQAAKDYTLQITSEAKVGIEAKTQRDKLHTNLLVLRKAVINAKQAVINAIKVARAGSPSITTATSSGLNKRALPSGSEEKTNGQ